MSKYLNDMVKRINKIYVEFNNTIDESYKSIIKRGHVPSMSYIVENEIAYYIMNLLGKKSGYKCYIDFSVSDKGKYYRPDILVFDSNNKVQYIFEIKSNMGWCRELTEEQIKHYKVIKDKLSDDNFSFQLKRLIRELDNSKDKSNYEYYPKNGEKFYGNKSVKYIFLSYSILNISSKKEVRNKKIRNNYNKLNNVGINLFFLTQAWYQEYENWQLSKYDEEYIGIKDLDIFAEDFEELISK